MYGCACSYGVYACFCASMSVFVSVCVYLVHLLTVCDASDRGRNPEPQNATSSRGSARGREGGASWKERMGEIPFKVGVMIQPCKASQHFVSLFSLSLHYQPCRWEDTQQASLTPKANECEFPHRLSDCSSFKVLDFGRRFSQRYRKAGCEGCL